MFEITNHFLIWKKHGKLIERYVKMINKFKKGEINVRGDRFTLDQFDHFILNSWRQKFKQKQMMGVGKEERNMAYKRA